MRTGSDISIDAYTEAAIRHTAATLQGDHTRANSAHDTLAAIYRARRAQGREAQLELLPLLNHENAGVRNWAASHALEFAPEKAVPILEKLATDDPGLIGFGAKMTLSEWKAGRLSFP